MMLVACRMNNRASCDKAFDSHLAVGFIVRCDVFKKSWGDSPLSYRCKVGALGGVTEAGAGEILVCEALCNRCGSQS